MALSLKQLESISSRLQLLHPVNAVEIFATHIYISIDHALPQPPAHRKSITSAVSHGIGKKPVCLASHMEARLLPATSCIDEQFRQVDLVLRHSFRPPPYLLSSKVEAWMVHEALRVASPKQISSVECVRRSGNEYEYRSAC